MVALFLVDRVLGHVAGSWSPEGKLSSLGRSFAGWIVSRRSPVQAGYALFPRLFWRQRAPRASDDHLAKGCRSSPAASISNEIGLRTESIRRPYSLEVRRPTEPIELRVVAAPTARLVNGHVSFPNGSSHGHHQDDSGKNLQETQRNTSDRYYALIRISRQLQETPGKPSRLTKSGGGSIVLVPLGSRAPVLDIDRVDRAGTAFAEGSVLLSHMTTAICVSLRAPSQQAPPRVLYGSPYRGGHGIGGAASTLRSAGLVIAPFGPSTLSQSSCRLDLADRAGSSIVRSCCWTFAFEEATDATTHPTICILRSPTIPLNLIC